MAVVIMVLMVALKPDMVVQLAMGVRAMGKKGVVLEFDGICLSVSPSVCLLGLCISVSLVCLFVVSGLFVSVCVFVCCLFL